MALYEVDDLDVREAHLTAHGVRIVWRIDLPSIRARHLHPADVGGAIVSIDQPVPNGSWTWGGPTWRPHQETTIVTAIAGSTIAATDPAAMRARWSSLGFDHAVRFVTAGPLGEGMDGLDLVAADRDRAGEQHRIGGLTITLV